MRRRQSHGADAEIIERTGMDGVPVDGGAVDGEHDRVADMAREQAQTGIVLHHEATGRRAMRSASGCERAYASSIAGRICARSASWSMTW